MDGDSTAENGSGTGSDGEGSPGDASASEGDTTSPGDGDGDGDDDVTTMPEPTTGDPDCCEPMELLEFTAPASCENPGGIKDDASWYTYAGALIVEEGRTVIRLSNSQEYLCEPDAFDFGVPCEGNVYVHQIEIEGEFEVGNTPLGQTRYTNFSAGVFSDGGGGQWCDENSWSPAIGGISVDIESIEPGCITGVLHHGGNWCCSDFPFVASLCL